MSSLGELSVSLKLDLDGFNQHLRQLEKRRIAPLSLAVALDTKAIQKQLQRLTLKPVTIAAEFDTRAIRQSIANLNKEMQSLSKVRLEAIPVRFRLESQKLNQDLQRFSDRRVETTVRLNLDASGAERQLNEFRTNPIEIAFRANLNSLQGDLERLSRLQAPSISAQINLDEEQVRNRIREVQKGVGTVVIPFAFKMQDGRTGEQRLQQSFERLGQGIAKSGNLNPTSLPTLTANDQLPADANGSYNPQRQTVQLTSAKLKRLQQNTTRDLSGFSGKELEQTISELSTIAHELFHAGQYGFQASNPVELAKSGGSRLATPQATEADEAQIKRLKGASIEALAQNSAAGKKALPVFKKLNEADQKLVLETSAELERGAYSFQAKFITEMLTQIEQAKSQTGATLSEVFDATIARLTGELSGAAGQLEGAVGAPLQLDGIEQAISSLKAQVQEGAQAITLPVQFSLEGALLRQEIEVLEVALKKTPVSLPVQFVPQKKTLQQQLETIQKELKQLTISLNLESDFAALAQAIATAIGEGFALGTSTVQNSELSTQNSELEPGQPLSGVQSPTATPNPPPKIAAAPQIQAVQQEIEQALTQVQAEVEDALGALLGEVEEIDIPQSSPQPVETQIEQAIQQVQSEVDNALGDLLGGLGEVEIPVAKPADIEQPLQQAVQQIQGEIDDALRVLLGGVEETKQEIAQLPTNLKASKNTPRKERDLLTIAREGSKVVNEKLQAALNADANTRQAAIAAALKEAKDLQNAIRSGAGSPKTLQANKPLFEQYQKLLQVQKQLQQLQQEATPDLKNISLARVDLGALQQQVGKAIGQQVQSLVNQAAKKIDAEGFAVAAGGTVGRLVGSQFGDAGALARELGGRLLTRGAIAGIKGFFSQAVKQQQIDVQKTYEALVKEAAKISGVGLKPEDIPKLTVDDGRLKEVGARALYDVKNNQILITQGLADLLGSSIAEIEENQHLVADILHEARHALQFDFGRSSISQIASGQKDFGVDTFTSDPAIASTASLKGAEASVQAAKQQAGGSLPKQAERTIRRAEVDAYEFEQTATPKAVSGLGDQLKDIAIPKSVSQVFSEFGDSIGIGTKQIDGFKNALATVLPGLNNTQGGVKGLVTAFVGFQVLNGLQNLIFSVGNGIAQFGADCVKAGIQLSKFQTALNFASGGAAAGAKNLQFIKKTVEELRVPLIPAIEGFTKFAVAARGSALEGKGTKDLFVGVSQAATVLGLSADETSGAMKALEQMMSKGKVQAEELRGQLAERIPGAFQLAARAMGVTEKQLNAMLEQGQVYSEDFLPKFAKQLQSEFGDAAKEASGNAQAAMNAFGNSMEETKAAIGQAVQPAVVAIFNSLSVAMQAIATVAPLVGSALAAIAVAAAVQVAPALATLIAQLYATQIASGAAVGSFGKFLTMLNTSKAVMGAVGIFALIEGIKLFANAINTELVVAWQKAAEAAQDAAEKSREANDARPKPKEDQGTGNPFVDYANDVQTLGAGKVIDDIAGVFSLGGNYRTGNTFQAREKENLQIASNEFVAAQNDLLSNAGNRLARLQISGGGELKQVDEQLASAESNRRAIKTKADRDFTQKGLAIPPEIQQQLQTANAQVSELTQKRSELQKPFTDDLNLVTKQIEAVKSQIEGLDDPKQRKKKIALGLDPDAEKAQLQSVLKDLQKFKQTAEFTLASMKVDPVLALGAAFKELGLKLDEAARASERFATQQKTATLTRQVANFSTDVDAGRKAGVENAQTDLESTNRRIADRKKALAKTEKELDNGGSQQALAELGLNKDSSLGEIDAVLAGLGDSQENQNKKRLAEGLKQFRESKDGLANLENTQASQQASVQQAKQDLALNQLDRRTADQAASLQRRSNDRQVEAIKSQLSQFSPGLSARDSVVRGADTTITSAQNDLAATQQAQADNAQQLGDIRDKYQKGLISAEEFHKRERDLVNQSSELKVKAAQNELAVKEAVQKKALALIEFEAQQAENKTKRAESGAAVKRSARQANVVRLRSQKRITEEDAAIANADIQSQAARDDAKFTGQRENAAEKQLAQLQDSYQKGQIASDEFYKREAELTNQIADLKARKAQTQVQIEEAAAAKIEAINRKIIRQFELSIKKAESAIAISQSNRQASANQNLLNNEGAGELAGQAAANSSALGDISASKQRMALKQQELAFNRRLVAEGRRDATEGQEKEIQLLQEIAQLKADAVAKELDLVKQVRAARIAYQKELYNLQQGELDLQSRLIDGQKQLVDAYNGLQKALNDAAQSGAQSQLNNTDRALDLARGLKDGRFKGQQKQVAQEQLQSLGFSSNPQQAEKEILEKKAQIEDEIARKKAEAMLLELEYQQKSLEFEYAKFKIAQERAKLEAEKQVIDSKRKVDDSELALNQAKKDLANAKSPEEKRAAQANLEKAQLDNDLAKRELNFSVKNYLAQDALTAMGEEAFGAQRQALGASRNAKISEFANSDRLREMQQSLDLAGVGSRNNQDSGVTGILNGQGSQINTGDMSRFGPSADSLKFLQTVMKGDGLKVPGIQARNAEVSDRVSTIDRENGGLTGQFKRLADAVMASTSKPTSISVSGSERPVEDAATLHRKINTNRVMSSSSF